MDGVKLPELRIYDPILLETFINVWKRIPEDTRDILLRVVNLVVEIPGWDTWTRASANGQINCAKWTQYDEQPRGEVVICEEDCSRIIPSVIVGTIAHEFGHAYQTAITPKNCSEINRAGDELPMVWGFATEIAALKVQRQLPPS